MITASRNQIAQAINHLASRLNFSTTTLEYDLNERCTVFVDVECSGCAEGREMEITAVELTKDGACTPNSYPNIASYIGRRLDAIVGEMNDEAYQNVRDWEYETAYRSCGF